MGWNYSRSPPRRGVGFFPMQPRRNLCLLPAVVLIEPLPFVQLDFWAIVDHFMLDWPSACSNLLCEINNALTGGIYPR